MGGNKMEGQLGGRRRFLGFSHITLPFRVVLGIIIFIY